MAPDQFQLEMWVFKNTRKLPQTGSHFNGRKHLQIKTQNMKYFYLTGKNQQANTQ